MLNPHSMSERINECPSTEAWTPSLSAQKHEQDGKQKGSNTPLILLISQAWRETMTSFLEFIFSRPEDGFRWPVPQGSGSEVYTGDRVALRAIS